MSPEPVETNEAEESPQRGPYMKKQKRQKREEDLFHSALNVLSSINSKVITPAAAPPPPTQVTFGQYIDSLLSKMDGHPRIQSKVKWAMLEVYKEGEEEMYNTAVQ